jgi:hypothetical protein
MSLADTAGLIGVLLILAAYAGGAVGKLDPARAPALATNFVGAGLILYSLMEDFNLASALLEAAWALIALLGLLRIALKRRDP